LQRRARTPRSHTGGEAQKRTGPHEGARWISMPLWGTATTSRGEHAGADARSGRTTASASHAPSYADGPAMSQCTHPHDCHAAKFHYDCSDRWPISAREKFEEFRNASAARWRRGSRGRLECARRI
jgi:hypothetical protein